MCALPRRTVLKIAAVTALGACSPRPTGSSLGPTSTILPVAPASSTTLESALRTRRSIRSFTDRSVPQDVIARLLWAAQGQTASWGGRTAPSAGALYPIELLVATPDGLRRYLPSHGATQDVATDDRRLGIAIATGSQAAPTHAPVLFVITGIVDRTAEKYGSRAERYVHLEAGHVCQNLLLEATALGLGAVPIGAFDDDLLRDAIDAGDDESPLYVVPVGYPARDA